MSSLLVPAAYYAARVADFISEPEDSILGTLTRRAGGVDPTQTQAWLGEIEILKAALVGVEGMLLLEFVVPRIGSRIDAVLICS